MRAYLQNHTLKRPWYERSNPNRNRITGYRQSVVRLAINRVVILSPSLRSRINSAKNLTLKRE
jgi:hypothetical protein